MLTKGLTWLLWQWFSIFCNGQWIKSSKFSAPRCSVSLWRWTAVNEKFDPCLIINGKRFQMGLRTEYFLIDDQKGRRYFAEHSSSFENRLNGLVNFSFTWKIGQRSTYKTAIDVKERRMTWVLLLRILNFKVAPQLWIHSIYKINYDLSKASSVVGKLPSFFNARAPYL